MLLDVYGKLPQGDHLQKIKQSPNFEVKGFKNLSKTPMMSEDTSYPKMLRDFFFSNPPNKIPSRKLPSVKTDLFSLNSSKPIVVWFGHSSYLIKINGKNILVDPVFSGSASPVSFMVKAFDGSNVYGVDDMPVIDVLILTHDHYDHLDHKTILKLKPKVKQVCCSLGVGSHLTYWGYSKNRITEFDWWDSKIIDSDIELIAAPARHFSGRGLVRAKTLWSSFILRSKDHQLYLGGDSGYDSHFKTIGEKFGTFDLAILECGQYNVQWPYIHMLPEQTAQAAVDLNAKVLMPVHWSKFALAMHPWNESAQRVTKKANELHLQVTTPLIGEPVYINDHLPDKIWWNI